MRQITKFHIRVWLAKRWATNMNYTGQEWYDQVWNYMDSCYKPEPVVAG